MSENQTNNERRMLISLAHPDDESFGMGGTIAYYADAGVDIHLICSTNGDVGVAEPEFLERYESMTDLRLAELQCAAQELGFKKVYTFGYRDSGMEGAPDNQHPDSLYQADMDVLVGQIVRVIRKVRPQVVVTFEPYGGYGHPDHIKMHHATRKAFQVAADPEAYPEHLEEGLEPYQPAKLYYRTRPRQLSKVLVKLMPLFGQDPTKMGRNDDINLKEIVEHSYPIHARINTRAVAEQAERARQCHASQLGGFGAPGLMAILQRLISAPHIETFMRAEPPVNGNRVRESDLFAGVKSDRS